MTPRHEAASSGRNAVLLGHGPAEGATIRWSPGVREEVRRRVVLPLMEAKAPEDTR